MSVKVPPLFRYTREMRGKPVASLSREQDIQVAVVVVIAPGHRAEETPVRPAPMSVNVPLVLRYTLAITECWSSR